jgi:hypothetical protein
MNVQVGAQHQKKKKKKNLLVNGNFYCTLQVRILQGPLCVVSNLQPWCASTPKKSYFDLQQQPATDSSNKSNKYICTIKQGLLFLLLHHTFKQPVDGAASWVGSRS